MQKHIQQEECDVLPFSTCSTEVFNGNRVKKSAILVDRLQLFTDTTITIDNGIRISLANLAIFKSK